MKSNVLNVFKVVVRTPYLLLLLVAALSLSCFVVVTACAHDVRWEGQSKVVDESKKPAEP